MGQIKLMEDALNVVLVLMKTYATIYIIITVIDIIKSSMHTIARILSNGIFLVANMVIFGIDYYVWYFFTGTLWAAITGSIILAIGMVVLNIMAIDERSSDSGGDNGVINLFNSFIRHKRNIKDYNQNIKRLRSKHKIQIS